MAIVERTWKDEYEGRKRSYLYAFVFGPLYFLTYRFWIEAVITAITFPFGNLIAVVLVHQAWKRRAQKAADVKNTRQLMQQVVFALEAARPRPLSRHEMAELEALEASL